MKKCIIPAILIVFACSIISTLLMSHVPKSNSPKGTLGSSTLTEEAMAKLVDEAFVDPMYQQITSEDLDRFLLQVSNPAAAKEERWHELSKKANFSKEESNYIVACLGFKDMDDYRAYVKLFVSLAKKYDVFNLAGNDQKLFFNGLRNRELKYIADSNLLAKSHGQPGVRPAAGPGGIRPECWKCVVDYQSCLQPYIGTVQTTYENSITVDLVNSAGHTFMSTVFNPTWTTILYINNTYTQADCDNMYRSCISTCNQ
ncbi:MAG: hypothetical protein J0H07_06700 [Sphingobacteriales bacterium]|nr:hypothetical protein [Sphingobacteriales bacterium]